MAEIIWEHTLFLLFEQTNKKNVNQNVLISRMLTSKNQVVKNMYR
jgi:hypothetical protein